MSWQRPDHRQPDQIRSFSFQREFAKFATSSVLARCGDTQVLCAVTVEDGVPDFLVGKNQGWLTAEYRMLPAATPKRHARELLKLSGRTQEIQRLIGRSLRAALDLKALGERTVIIDADVLQADAGTRTTAITGGFVALADAMNQLVEQGVLMRSPICNAVAAISVGLIQGEPLLDLCYAEDVAAEVDFNVVMNDQQEIIELQGTAEHHSFNRHQLNQILDFAEKGIQELFVIQQQALKG